jgi:hypothetical protein
MKNMLKLLTQKPMKNNEFKSKKITTSDGTIMYTFDGKLHNWEGPALIPEGNNKKREYYHKKSPHYVG